jgi:hypothetical protein
MLGSSTCIPPVAERTASCDANLRSIHLGKSEIANIIKKIYVAHLKGWKGIITLNIFLVEYC